MKSVFIFVISLLILKGICALPAQLPSDDAEIIPRRRLTALNRNDESDDDFKVGFDGVIDTGARYPFFQPHPQPFGISFGAFDSFDDLFRRLRNQLLGSAELPGIGSTDIGISDDKKGKTTSTVKIVNGHKVEVNETVYGEGDNVFKVRVVNIRPVSDEDENVDDSVAPKANPVTEGPSQQPPKEPENSAEDRREPLENHVKENEIRGNFDDPEVNI